MFEVFFDVRKLLNYLLESLPFVSEASDLTVSDVVISDQLFANDAFVIDHMTCFKVPGSRNILNKAVGDKVYISSLIASFGNPFTLVEPKYRYLFKIPLVEVILSILEERIHIYDVLVHLLNEWGLQCRREYLEKVSYFFVIIELFILCVGS